MIIKLSHHAVIRSIKRKIEFSEIENTILEPKRVKLKQDCIIAMKLRKNGHLLMVYYTIQSGYVIVITVIETSKIDKYLN